MNDDILGKSLKTVIPVANEKFYSYFKIKNTGENYYYMDYEEKPNVNMRRTKLYIRNIDLHGFIKFTYTQNANIFLLSKSCFTLFLSIVLKS